MKNDDVFIRGYYRASKSFYAKTLNSENIEVMFGMYSMDGGTEGEMSMEWEDLQGKKTALLRCFDDSWKVLSLFTDLIQRMGQVSDHDVQEEDFCKILTECGFKDMTQYINPYIDVETPSEETVNILMSKKEARKLGLINPSSDL